MEKDDAQLFSKPEPLLAEATELAYHTMNCSNLNAEELRREEGIEVKFATFSRNFLFVPQIICFRLEDLMH